MKIYLDDVRDPPDGTWTVARTATEARALFLAGPVEMCSLDHDLGTCSLCTVCAKGCTCTCHETGYDFVKWLAEKDLWSKFKPVVHSANPVGKTNMQAIINRYWRRS
jgi:hypothetical protein